MGRARPRLDRDSFHESTRYNSDSVMAKKPHASESIPARHRGTVIATNLECTPGGTSRRPGICDAHDGLCRGSTRHLQPHRGSSCPDADTIRAPVHKQHVGVAVRLDAEVDITGVLVEDNVRGAESRKDCARGGLFLDLY